MWKGFPGNAHLAIRADEGADQELGGPAWGFTIR